MKPEDFGDVFNRGYLSALKNCYRLLISQTDIEVAKKIILRDCESIKLQQRQKGSGDIGEDVNDWVYYNE